MLDKPNDKPFPLKRYYLVYAGIGSVIFYILLFTMIIKAERQALYDEYIYNVSAKAQGLYADIHRDFLIPLNMSVENIDLADQMVRKALRKEIEEIIISDFNLQKLKLLKANSVVLYDHDEPENEGKPYSLKDEPGLVSALKGITTHVIEVEEGGRRLIEAYLPIKSVHTEKVMAVLEIYEDVSRFERQVQEALKSALVLPTIIFALFNIVLFMIVAKADRIISQNTNLLIKIRYNMEKYLSQSAVSAIYQAVSQQKKLFKGERQSIVIFFSDIRGFTSYSEATEPEIVVENLNRLFQFKAEIIHRFGGVIDKFVGDELMVIFESNQETKAVEAGMEILSILSDATDSNFEIGIGIHTGEAVVGSIGTKNRRDYTAIGDTVNIGARLCGACPANNMLISSDVYKKLPAALQANFQSKQTIKLKGKKSLHVVYKFSPTEIPIS